MKMQTITKRTEEIPKTKTQQSWRMRVRKEFQSNSSCLSMAKNQGHRRLMTSTISRRLHLKSKLRKIMTRKMSLRNAERISSISIRKGTTRMGKVTMISLTCPMVSSSRGKTRPKRHSKWEQARKLWMARSHLSKSWTPLMLYQPQRAHIQKQRQ